MSVATARTFVLRCFVATVLVAAGAFLAAGRAMAQGVTTSAVRGTVSDEQGQPVVGATVLLTGSQTGARYQSETGSNGRYVINSVAVGSYTIEARAIGYRPVRQLGLVLTVGEAAELNLRMTASTVELAAITATGLAPTDAMSPARTGASSTISPEVVRGLPSLNRNFADFIATVPQVVGDVGSGGPSVGGQNNRYNNIQIDGSVNNDLFGLAGSGTPGGQANAKPISVEAIKEFQVLVAPYDVRQGGFTGGLVNAVTQSGTNEWHANAYGFYQGTRFLGHYSLVGRDSLHNAITDFTQQQYGVTVSGPLVKDKLLFWANLEPQTRSAPFTGVVIGSDTTGGADSVGIGIRNPTATRIAQIVHDSSAAWGGTAYDPGNIFAPALQTPSTNVFSKLTWQPGVNNTVEFSYNHVNGSTDVFGHNATAAFTSTNGGYQLSNAGYQQANTTNTYRMIWTRPVNSRINNELITAYQHIFDHRQVPSQFPLVFVGGDRGQSGLGPDAAPFGYIPTSTVPTNVSFGTERFSQGNSLDQKITEITDNLTLALGRGHTLTIGTHNELFNFHNVFFQGSYGIWSFKDTTELNARLPYRYEILTPTQPFSNAAVCTDSTQAVYNPLLCSAGATGLGPIADFHVQQYGGYVQDNYQPNSRLNITFGVRVDLPNMNRPNYNLKLDTTTIQQGPRVGQRMGINTQTSFPASNPLWSPRLGFNYDVTGDGTTRVRGGIGIFSGRPPYVWISNAFVNTGLEQVDLVCDGAFTAAGGRADSVPIFTTNLAAAPDRCRGASTQGSAASSVVYFDPSFKLPQNARLSLGMDHRLPWNMTGTVDLMFTQWLNAIYLTDVNLVPGGFEFGEGNRLLYGTPAANGSFTPRRLTANPITGANSFNDIIKQSNSNQDYSYQATFQIQKTFSNGLWFNAGYTYSRAYDLMSLTSSISNSNLRFAVLDGTLDNRNLRPAAFDTPDRVTLTMGGDLPFGFSGSLQYAGRSGTPYAYVTSNDANGDGLAGQDLVYVPLNAQDIQMCPLSGACTALSQDPAAYAQLNQYINAEPCLASQRGQIMRRTSCRNPWTSFVNSHLEKSIPTVGGQRVTLSADIFNLLSLLGVGGKVTATSASFEETNLLTLGAYNAAAGRGVYRFATSLANLNRVDTVNSRWRMLLGLRYSI